MILFPKDIYCISCEKPILSDNEDSLCDVCRENLLYNLPKQCSICGRFLGEAEKGPICFHCYSDESAYEKGIACTVYAGTVKHVIYRLKYAGQGYLARNIGAIMYQKAVELPDFDLIVAAPVHNRKKKQRGYDQAELIAGNLADRMNKKIVQNNLVRMKETKPMSGLSALERKRNVEGAFNVARPEEFRNQTILLVDDILTSGATCHACSKMLLEQGAERVYVIVFAAAYFDMKMR